MEIVALAILKKLWPYLLAATVVLSSLGYFWWLKHDNVELKAQVVQQQVAIGTAVDANQENVKAFKELQKEQEEERKATAQSVAREATLSSAAEQVKKEMRNDPQANTPAGPYWDGVSDRLRELQQAAGSH